MHGYLARIAYRESMLVMALTLNGGGTMGFVGHGGVAGSPFSVRPTAELRSTSAPRHRPLPIAMEISKGSRRHEKNNDALLSQRIASMQENVSDVHIIVLDQAVVPRQRIELTLAGPIARRVRELRDQGGTLCIVGKSMAPGSEKTYFGLNAADGSVLQHGVEARIVSLSSVRQAIGFYSSHTLRQRDSYVALDTVLVAGRRFQIIDADAPVWPPMKPVRGLSLLTARVRWISDEVASAPGTIRASARLHTLVHEWLDLVRVTGRERLPGQPLFGAEALLNRILADLGPMPDAEDADECALWVAALINPAPPLGVAIEVRPAALTARTSDERIDMVRRGLSDSIDRLKRGGK